MQRSSSYNRSAGYIYVSQINMFFIMVKCLLILLFLSNKRTNSEGDTID